MERLQKACCFLGLDGIKGSFLPESNSINSLGTAIKLSLSIPHQPPVVPELENGSELKA